MAEFSNKAGRIESPAMGFSASAPLERDWFLGMQDKSKRQDMNKATLESDTVESPIARQNSGAEIADRLSDRRHQSLHFDERKHEQSPRNSELETYFRLRRHRNLNRKKLLLKAFLLSLYTPAQIGIVSLVLQYMQCSKGLVLLFFISSLLFGIARFYCQYQKLQDEFWEETAKEHPNLAKLAALGGIEALDIGAAQPEIAKHQVTEKKHN